MAPEAVPIPAAVSAAMSGELPALAQRTVAAIIEQVPSYADAFAGRMGRKIGGAVELALGGFLQLATTHSGADPGTPIEPALAAAYDLGRGEARSGRSMDALLAAYRVGARVSWRELSATAVSAGLSGEQLARFAELVFAFIDQLSAASVRGHADELATTGRVRQRYLERLAGMLLAGADEQELTAAAERAGWAPPRTLTAVLLPEPQLRGTMVSLDPRTLRGSEDVSRSDGEPDGEAELVVLLVPDAEDRSRPALLRSVAGRGAIVGPARPWLLAGASYARACRALQLGLLPEDAGSLDTDARLAELILRADPEAVADLRAQVLAPLEDLTPAAREKLIDTLRSWLLHHGRREQVAAQLFVHPQTVRYRMGQLRELYGDRLEDPRALLDLTLALGVDGG